MQETILSTGIDIGTSTTQLVFSRIIIDSKGGFGAVPKIEIIAKDIIYKSGIYFTPFLSEEEIDGKAVRDIIMAEYGKAGMLPEDLSTGAIIITGESSRKINAESIVKELSCIAGEFVVVTAGPDLESVLAGKGSGAERISKETGKVVANLDVGGGTTNICFFKDGEILDLACFDIGGRLIRVKDGKVTYIAEKMKKLLEHEKIVLRLWDKLEDELAKRIAEIMTGLLAQSVGLLETSSLLEKMKTNQLITCGIVPDYIIFSGGVADCIYNSYPDRFWYGDIGIYLGAAIKKSGYFDDKLIKDDIETLSATVVGAGNYSMEVSGSTIEYSFCTFPFKNIPITYVNVNDDSLDTLEEEIRKSMIYYKGRGGGQVQIALAMKGPPSPSFIQIEKMAEQISNAMKEEVEKGRTLIVVVEADIGKALGQAIKRSLPKKSPLLCIDKISCRNGDYIDIGKPIASGRAVPIVVKTLIFEH